MNPSKDKTKTDESAKSSHAPTDTRLKFNLEFEYPEIEANFQAENPIRAKYMIIINCILLSILIGIVSLKHHLETQLSFTETEKKWNLTQRIVGTFHSAVTITNIILSATIFKRVKSLCVCVTYIQFSECFLVPLTLLIEVKQDELHQYFFVIYLATFVEIMVKIFLISRFRITFIQIGICMVVTAIFDVITILHPRVNNYCMIILVYSILAVNSFMIYYSYNHIKGQRLMWLKNKLIRQEYSDNKELLDSINSGIAIIKENKISKINNFMVGISRRLKEQKQLLKKNPPLRKRSSKANLATFNFIHSKDLQTESSPIFKQGDFSSFKANQSKSSNKELNKWSFLTDDEREILSLLENFYEVNLHLPELLYFPSDKEKIEKFDIPRMVFDYRKALESGYAEMFDSYNYIGTQYFQRTDDHEELYLEIYLKVKDSQTLIVKCDDVTRRKVLDERITKINMKSMIMSKVSHEFKNPLNVIQILSSAEELEQSELLENMKTIANLTEFLLILVKDFNTTVTLDTGISAIEIKRDPVDIRHVKEFIHKIFSTKNSLNTKSIRFEIDQCTDDGSFMFNTDDLRLKQIMINLIENAFKFSNSGTVRARLGIGTVQSERILKLEVSDNGPGIEPEIRNLLNNPNSKSEDLMEVLEDSQVGLILIKELSSKMNGKLKVQSDRTGTKFEISFFDKPSEKSNGRDTVSKPKSNKKISSIIDNIVHSADDLESQLSKINEKSENFIEKSDNIDFRERSYINPKATRLIPSSQSVRRKNQSIIDSSCSSIESSQPRNDQTLVYTRTEHIRNEQTTSKVLKNMLKSPIVNEISLSVLCPTELKYEKSIIVIDDERVIRESNIKILRRFLNDQGLRFNILSARDGIEGLYVYYKALMGGYMVKVIFSDETMNFMNGRLLARVLNFDVIKFNADCTFYLVTSYENLQVDQTIARTIIKPLTYDSLRSVEWGG